MADPDGRLIGDLGAPTEGSTEPRQEGWPTVWPLAVARTLRMASAVLAGELGTPDLVHRIAAALDWAFRFGQRVGQGTAGPALRCPGCKIRAAFADPAGPVGQARCLSCDHSWTHAKAGTL